MKLTWFGHSAFRIEYGGAVVMLDPFLANPTLKGNHKAAYKGATHVILSHGHNDHVGSTAEICDATGATLVANPEVCAFLECVGVENTEHINIGGEIELRVKSGRTSAPSPVTVAFVPAWHSSSNDAQGSSGRYLGNPAGIVLMAKTEKTLYYAGDTGIFGDMKLIAELYNPKIGIVPIGDRFTMGARLAAFACKRFFDFETVIPCHYGTFDLLDQKADKFLAEMKGSKTKVRVPKRRQVVKL